MSDPGKKLDDSFRDKLEDFEIAPPERVWSGIANKLDREDMNNNKRRLAWLWRFSILSLIVSFIAVGIVVINNKAADNTIASNTNTAPGTGADNTNDNTTAKDNSVTGTPGNTANTDGKNVATLPSAGNNTGADNGSPVQSTAGTSKHINTKSKVSATSSYTASTSSSGNKTATGSNTGNTQQGTTGNSSADRDGSSTASTTNKSTENTSALSSSASQEPDGAERITLDPNAVTLLLSERDIVAGLTPLPPYDPATGNKPCPRWSIGVHYLHATTYRKATDNKFIQAYNPNNYHPWQQTAAHFDSVETKSKGYSKGFDIGYNVLPRLTLRAGFDVSKYEWQSKMAEAIVHTDPEAIFLVNTSSSYYYSDTLGEHGTSQYGFFITAPGIIRIMDTVTLVHRYDYRSVPVSLSYRFTRPCSKFGVSVNAGVAASFLKEYTLTQDGRGMKPEMSFTRSRSWEMMGGVSLSYTFFRHLSFEVQPVYRKFIKPVNKFTPVKLYPYMWGVQGGVSLKF
jgi:hypothetical protein